MTINQYKEMLHSIQTITVINLYRLYRSHTHTQIRMTNESRPTTSISVQTHLEQLQPYSVTGKAWQAKRSRSSTLRIPLFLLYASLRHFLTYTPVVVSLPFTKKKQLCADALTRTKSENESLRLNVVCVRIWFCHSTACHTFSIQPVVSIVISSSSHN